MTTPIMNPRRTPRLPRVVAQRAHRAGAVVSRTATITLGRDGMGDNATEADFDSWVTYVASRIDEATGLDVTVNERRSRDVQEDAIRVEGTEDSDPSADREMVRGALAWLWNAWCSQADGRIARCRKCGRFAKVVDAAPPGESGDVLRCSACDGPQKLTKASLERIYSVKLIGPQWVLDGPGPARYGYAEVQPRRTVYRGRTLVTVRSELVARLPPCSRTVQS